MVDFLSDARHYPEGGPVEIRETHISLVFLTAGYAYKLLKPVDFGFLDFSTPEARYIDCWNEIRLNRRLADDVYLDVVPMTEQSGQLRFGGTGWPIDWVVKMRRLPDDATLAARINTGRAGTNDLDRLLAVLAPFFRRAPRGPRINADAEPPVIRGNALENLGVLRKSALAKHLDLMTADRLRSELLQFLATRGSLFDERIRDGWICEGHGDLRAEHVYMTDPLVVVDCIEFNNRFRHNDMLDEICFLATDLERLGREDLAAGLIEIYRERLSDPAPAELVGFFKSYRESVRGKVACLLAAEQTGDEAASAWKRAAGHLDAAVGHPAPFHRPLLIVCCGMSGSGKSTIAENLAETIGATPLSSDRMRKELYGLKPTERPANPEQVYSRQASEKTYRELLNRAGEVLSKGVSVILDATFQRRPNRDAVRQTADDSDLPVLFVECRCPIDVAARRIADRRHRPETVSDADVRVLQEQQTTFDPLDELPPDQHLILNTQQPVAESIRQIVDRLSVNFIASSF